MRCDEMLSPTEILTQVAFERAAFSGLTSTQSMIMQLDHDAFNLDQDDKVLVNAKAGH